MPAFAPATIAGLAKACGIDVESIRLYQRQGLLSPPRRLRHFEPRLLYHADHIERLGFIRRARDLGFSLEAIGAMLGVNGGLVTCGDVLRIASRHLDDIRARIASGAEAGEVTGNRDILDDLNRIEAMLVPLVESCSGRGTAAECRFLGALSGPP